MRDRVTGRENLQKLIGNTGWLFADRILRIGIGLVVGVWIARYLGPDRYGLFNYAGAFVALFSIFATLGLDGIVVRELVQDPNRKDEILGTAFALKLAGSGVTLVVAVTGILLLRPAETLVHWLVAIIAAGTIVQSLDTIDLWFQARVESRFSVYARSSAFLLVSALKVFLILKNAPLIAFAWAGAIELLLGSAGLVLAYRINGQRPFAWKVSGQRIRRTLKECWPLALSGVAVMLYMKIDQVMLGQMLGNKAVGVYSAAIRISEVWLFHSNFHRRIGYADTDRSEKGKSRHLQVSSGEPVPPDVSNSTWYRHPNDVRVRVCDQDAVWKPVRRSRTDPRNSHLGSAFCFPRRGTGPVEYQ